MVRAGPCMMVRNNTEDIFMQLTVKVLRSKPPPRYLFAPRFRRRHSCALLAVWGPRRCGLGRLCVGRPRRFLLRCAAGDEPELWYQALVSSVRSPLRDRLVMPSANVACLGKQSPTSALCRLHRPAGIKSLRGGFEATDGGKMQPPVCAKSICHVADDDAPARM